MVHTIHQHEDGTLGVHPIDSIANSFTEKKDMSIHALTGNWQLGRTETACLSNDGYSAAIGNIIPPQCRIRLQYSYGDNAACFGLALQIDEAFDQGYYLKE